jgi:hypothetical protein
MESALVDQASEQFLGQWRHLVSTTNWEKGRIIHEWREALRAGDAPGSEYSDDAWSRRVGNVTPQHVGRLRRVFEQFYEVRESYPGLFWSHFQAALDWDDAPMWLEGAVVNGWSIADMRRKRFETLGEVMEEGSHGAAEPTGEPWDDDAEPDGGSDVVGGLMDTVHSPEGEAVEEEDAAFDHGQFDDDAPADAGEPQAPGVEARRPFADLPPLPPDVNDAFEAYKLCIVRHKLAGWQEISRDDMVASLDSLRQLALQPADG